MGLSERKITTWTKPISSLADRPQMSAAELKAAFDSNANEIKPKFNGLVDDLTGAGGASEIGASLDGVAGTNVQALLAALKALIDLRETTVSTDEKLSEKANQTTVNKTFKDISVNESTGVVTLTYVDGTTKAVNTSLSKIAVNFGFDAETQKITLTLNDGTTQFIDVSAFIKANEIVDSDNIVVARNADGTVSLSVKSGSINAEMLTSTILDELKAYRDAAAISAQNAAASESNAQTYKNAAANFSQSAQDALNETIQHKDTAYLHSQAALESKNAAAASATEAGQQAGSASGFAARAEEALSKMGVHIGSGAPTNGAKLWLCPVNNPLVMNPDRASSDMTQEVGVNDDGKLVTTVEDGSISESKLAQDVKDKLSKLSEDKTTVYVQAEEPTDVPEGTLWYDTDENAESYVRTVNGNAPDNNGDVKIKVPDGIVMSNAATVGQIIEVAEVDESGKPTAWTAVDKPGGGGSAEKEWVKLATIDFSQTENQKYKFEWIDLADVTEVFVRGSKVENSTETDSGMSLKVNDIGVSAQFALNKATGKGAYDYGYARFNGLFWEVRSSNGATSASTITHANTNAKYPYNVIMDVGKAKTVTIITGGTLTYVPKTGTLEVWVK